MKKVSMKKQIIYKKFSKIAIISKAFVLVFLLYISYPFLFGAASGFGVVCLSCCLFLLLGTRMPLLGLWSGPSACCFLLPEVRRLMWSCWVEASVSVGLGAVWEAIVCLFSWIMNGRS